ncbi:DUF1240 domain-containing protein [Shewanella sp. Scap07]|uniref:DUF1240 domain-containing protein n=1 Tax=Shewanella sp. Scap07 TaxID=2589987 RepID=UPI0015BE0C6F|nr:DUF1240 domain-containing protein [Shewanella sp. Scap07]QLE87008.1 DUF1240 domain-containing protein [Shewanella sp. Scap07]
MKIVEWKQADKKLSELLPKEIALCIGLPFLVAFICIAIANVFVSEIKIASSIGEAVYIKENSGRIPLIFLFFPFSFFLLASIQRLINFCPKLATEYFIKGAALMLPLFFLGIFIANFYVEHKLKQAGYNHCYWYTGASFRAPDVWLKNDSLCLQSGSLMQSDIANFFEPFNQQGTEPSLEELETFISETKQAREDYINGR